MSSSGSCFSAPWFSFVQCAYEKSDHLGPPSHYLELSREMQVLIRLRMSPGRSCLGFSGLICLNQAQTSPPIFCLPSDSRVCYSETGPHLVVQPGFCGHKGLAWWCSLASTRTALKSQQSCLVPLSSDKGMNHSNDQKPLNLQGPLLAPCTGHVPFIN